MRHTKTFSGEWTCNGPEPEDEFENTTTNYTNESSPPNVGNFTSQSSTERTASWVDNTYETGYASCVDAYSSRNINHHATQTLSIPFTTNMLIEITEELLATKDWGSWGGGSISAIFSLNEDKTYLLLKKAQYRVKCFVPPSRYVRAIVTIQTTLDAVGEPTEEEVEHIFNNLDKNVGEEWFSEAFDLPTPNENGVVEIVDVKFFYGPP